MTATTTTSTTAADLPRPCDNDDQITTSNNNDKKNSDHHHDRSGIPNFRPITLSRNLFRSAAPDNHISIPPSSSDQQQPTSSLLISESEDFVFHKSTLWIDLRFEQEIQPTKLKDLLDNAPGGPYQRYCMDNNKDSNNNDNDNNNDDDVLSLMTSSSPPQRLYVYSKCGMSIDTMTKYAMKHWIPPSSLSSQQQLLREKEKVTTTAGGDNDDHITTTNNNHNHNDKAKMKAAIFQALQQQGLAGLFQVVLDRQDFILRVLQTITVHLEQHCPPDSDNDSGSNSGSSSGKVLIHCTLGKDRTGIISMLCQSMLGATDEQIIHDFTLSQVVADIAAEKMKHHFGGGDDNNNDISFLCGAEAQTMIDTLSFIRHNHGSINGYLDLIGFDQEWRQRFVAVA